MIYPDYVQQNKKQWIVHLPKTLLEQPLLCNMRILCTTLSKKKSGLE